MPNSNDASQFLLLLFFFSIPATIVSICGAIFATRSSVTLTTKIVGLIFRSVAAIVTGHVVTLGLSMISILFLGYGAAIFLVPIIVLITAISCWTAWKVATIGTVRSLRSEAMVSGPQASPSEARGPSGVRRDVRLLVQLFGLLIAWIVSGFLYLWAITASQQEAGYLLLLVPVILVRAGILAAGGWIIYRTVFPRNVSQTPRDPTSSYLPPVVGWGILGAFALLVFFGLAYVAFFSEG